jgi:hypothetical protein
LTEKIIKKILCEKKIKIPGESSEFYFPHVEEMMAGIENKKLELVPKK